MSAIGDAVYAAVEEVIIRWHWIDTDGQPTNDGKYLCGIRKTCGTEMVMCFSREDGKWWNDTSDDPIEGYVVAWAELPAFPTRTA